MESLVFVLVLLATAAFTTTALTVTADNNMVTVREGELIHLSCSISLDSEGIKDVRWYRDSDSAPYGYIDVTNCGVFLSPCPKVNTTDHRGVVQYNRGLSNDATLTLVIDHSSMEDNTTFTCGVLKNVGNTFLRSENINVTVQHLPNSTYPMCLTLSDQSSASVNHSLSCLADKGWPVVSLEWTAMGRNSNQIPLSNQTEIVGNQVQSILWLNETGMSFNYSVFTCHMESSAFPHVQRNCSVTVVSMYITNNHPTGPTDISTPIETTSISTHQREMLTSGPSLNIVFIASTTSASVVIIIILLVIISCLVCSRKKRRREAEDPQDLSIRLSVAFTSPGPQTNHPEVHVYGNTTDSPPPYHQRPGNVELDEAGVKSTPHGPPSPLYAEVPSVKEKAHLVLGDGCMYAVSSKPTRHRGVVEDVACAGYQDYESQDPLDYAVLEQDTGSSSQGQEPSATGAQSSEGMYAKPGPGSGAGSLGTSTRDEEEQGKLVENIIYAPHAETGATEDDYSELHVY